MERRKTARIGFNLRVTLVHSEGEHSTEILRANLAWGGVGGFSRDPVEEKKEAVVRIYFPQRSGAILSEEVSGRIVWSRRDGNFTALGMAFGQLDSSSTPQLISYLRCAEQFD